MKTLLFGFALLLAGSFVQAQSTGSFYSWGVGVSGFAYCYEYTNDGNVLNNGQAQPNEMCEATSPSFYSWGEGQDGWGHCYHYSPINVVMDEGQAQSDSFCEASQPSIFSWGEGQDGYTHCYEYAPQGWVLNAGQPVRTIIVSNRIHNEITSLQSWRLRL